MKLGRLLVKGFHKKQRKPRVPRPASPVKKKLTTTPAIRQSPSINLAPESHVSITLENLLRPGNELRNSYEGFLLDQRSPHTRKAYGKDLKRFIQFLLVRRQTQNLQNIDRSTLIAYKESLISEKLEHTTIDRHLATLKSFFRWLVEDGHMTQSPADKVRFLNPKKLSTTSGFTDAEVRKILSLPNMHTRTGSQHYAILMILFYAGLRRSELCSLKTSHLSQERGHTILKLKGKGNAERIVVLTTPVWNALEHYFRITGRKKSTDLPLFTAIRNNRTGILLKPLDPSMIYYIVVRYAREAGIQHRVSPHSCRATAISNARDHDVPDRAIQEFAGWSSPQMITHYDKRKGTIEKSAAHAIDYGITDLTKL